MAGIVYGPPHMKSSQGILKLIEVLLSFIGLLCVAVDSYSVSVIDAYIAGTVIAMLIAVIILILHISKVAESIQGVLAFQIYFNIIWFIYCLVVSSVLISKYWGDRFTAGGSFGIILAFVYVIDAFDCYKNDPSPIFCVNS